MCLPAAAAAITCVACMECGVASTTASTLPSCSRPSYSVVRCKPFCLANAPTSGVMVRVVPETKRMTSLFPTASTSVLPHQPSPTMPALIIYKLLKQPVGGPNHCGQVGVCGSLRSDQPSDGDLGPGQHGKGDAA